VDIAPLVEQAQEIGFECHGWRPVSTAPRARHV
jgi:hypothetical protein